jgi:hypothetical protein
MAITYCIVCSGLPHPTQQVQILNSGLLHPTGWAVYPCKDISKYLFLGQRNPLRIYSGRFISDKNKRVKRRTLGCHSEKKNIRNNR